MLAVPDAGTVLLPLAGRPGVGHAGPCPLRLQQEPGPRRRAREWDPVHRRGDSSMARDED